MMTAKRYAIKPQDNLFGVVDNYSANKVCVINGIRTEIEAKWLCKDMNTLNDENEQLKEQLEICKDARQAYKQDWKACVSYCDTYEDEIHTLKDNIQGLIEENKMLKNNVEKLSEDVKFLG